MVTGRLSAEQPVNRVGSWQGLFLWLGVAAGLGAVASFSPSYALLGWAGLCVAALAFWNLTVGIHLVILCSFVYIRGSEEIELSEIGYGVLYASLIAGWYARRSVLRAGRLLRDWVDRSLFLFLAFALLSLGTAWWFGNDLLLWFRELIPLMTLLLYFPLVETLQGERDIRRIAWSYLTLSVGVGAHNILTYRQHVLQASQLWEYEAYRQTANEPLLFTCIVVLIAMIVFTPGWNKSTLLKAGVAGFFGIALVATFSRGYWFALVIALGFMVWLLPSHLRKQALSYLFLFLLFCFLIALVFLYHLFGPFLVAVGGRLGSLLQVTSDLALLNRLIEAKAVLDLFWENPIVGYGLGKTFSFRSIIPAHLPTWYVHNAYLYLAFKLGLVGLGLFLVFYGRLLWRGYCLYKRASAPLTKSLLLGLICCLMAMLPLSNTSPQFIQKDSLLFITLAAGTIQVLHDRVLVNE